MNSLAVVRIRLNGSRKPSWFPDLPCGEYREIPALAPSGTGSFLDRAIERVRSIGRPWVYFARDDLHPEGIDACISRLGSSGAGVGVFDLQKNGDPAGAISLAGLSLVRIEEELMPLLGDVTLPGLLPMFLFSRDRLLELWSATSLRRNRDGSGWRSFADLIVSGAVSLDRRVVLQAESSFDALAERAADLFDRSESAAGLEIADYLASGGSLAPRLERARAEALAKEARLIEAKLGIERYLERFSDDARAASLLSLLREEIPDYSRLGYDDYGPVLARIPSIAQPEEERALFDLVRSLPSGSSILEIGCGEGRFSALIALAGLDGGQKLFLQDDFARSAGDSLGELHDILLANLWRLALAEKVTVMSGALASSIRAWAERPPLDLIFVHGPSSYGDVVTELSQAYPMLKEGGFLVMYGTSPSNAGRWRVWREYALSMLGSPNQLGQLAFGRKQRGIPFPAKPLRPFSYSRELVRVMRETRPDLAALADALDMTTNPAAGSAQLDWAEKLIGKMPDATRSELRSMVRADGGEDPWLRYWEVLCDVDEAGQAGDLADRIDALLRMKLPGTLLRLRVLLLKEIVGRKRAT